LVIKMKLKFILFYFISFSFVFGQGQGLQLTKKQYYDLYLAKDGKSKSLAKIMGAQDRKRSVLDKGNVVLRLSNAAIYGYDP